jgi:hypothetical protein
MLRLRRSLRPISWILIIGFGIFFIYSMEHYKIERNALGNGLVVEDKPYSKEIMDKLNDIANYTNVSETDRLVLYFEPNTSSIAVKDKETSETWMSASNISDKVIGGSQLLKNSVKAPLNFTYTNYDSPIHEPSASNSITIPPKISKEQIDKGIRVNYEFEKVGISFAIEYTLDGDHLNVFIPVSSIHEKSHNLLVSIEPLPNLGAGTDQDKGYAFYPDGSGAISYFKEIHPQYKDKYSADVFGGEDVLKNPNSQTYLFLPVFGINRNGAGYAAYITKGEYETKINYYPSGYTGVNLNRVSSEFYYRRFYDAAVRRGEFAQRVEKTLKPVDHGISYVFLKKDHAEYADMAGVYRSYLLQSGKLKKTIGEQKEIPVAVDLFMGIKENQVLHDKFIKATTFDQAQQFLQNMKSAGVHAMTVILEGWMKDGEGDYPDSYRVSSELGGESKLKKLTKYAKETQTDLYLNFNNVDAFSTNLGFSKNRVVMKAPSKLALEDYYGESFLLNAAHSKDKFASVQGGKMSSYGPTGIDFANIGEMTLTDYNEYHPLSREGTVLNWLEMMNKSHDQNGKVAVHGGNLYVLGTADHLSDIPLKDNDYVYSDESVPFFQMVVHGFIPYSGDVPMNIHYDSRELFLKWIEYGSMPYFELTQGKPEEFRYTFYSKRLFSSTFDHWSPVLVQQYKEINEQLGQTWSQPMTNHRILERGVYETTYGDGTKVIVNYNSYPYVGTGIEVKSKDYAVLKGGLRK